MVATKVFIQTHSSSFSHGPAYFFLLCKQKCAYCWDLPWWDKANEYPQHVKKFRNTLLKKTTCKIQCGFWCCFFFVFFFIVFFLFGFYGCFKNISLISSRSFIKGGRKPENSGKKTTWPSISRTWLSHMWPDQGSNYSSEKPNGLRVSSPIH